jgi:branched-chain amino acid transport system permease protein
MGPSRLGRLVGRRGLVAVAVALAALLAGLNASSFESETRRLVIGTMINVVLVVGLYVFVGLSGVLSFGHLGFAAVGGYACALFTMDPQLKGYVLPDLPGFLAETSWGVVGGILVGAGVAALVALVVALPLTRLSGLSAGLATFAFLEIVHTSSKAGDRFTGGSSGLSGIPITTTPMVAAVAVAVVCVAAAAYEHSRFGLALRASRGDETAAGSVGIHVRRQRVVALVLSAAVMGAGGALYVAFLGVIGTESFYLDLTFLTLTMLVVGGMGSLGGAVAGAVGLSMLAEVVTRAQNEPVLGLQVPAWAGINDIVMASVLLLALFVRATGVLRRRARVAPA